MAADPPSEPALGELGISERLRRFVAEMPYERRSILDFVKGVAESVPPGAAVLDVGAGDAPYRELFAHTDYRTNDWEQSLHPGAREADYVGSADALPVADETFDLVLCTQVLEHVPEPAAVVAECARVLRAGGTFAATVPLVWQLHEQPHDYYRYTDAGVEHLLLRSGLVDCKVEPRNDCFATLAQLMLNVTVTMGRAADGLDERRDQAAALLTSIATEIASLAPLDVDMVLPLGYTALARRGR
jgi:SAM-dependent methyltransferase